MSTQERYGTEKQARTYSGEEYCHELLSWLNDESVDAGRQRVRRILDLFNQIREYWEMFPRYAPGQKVKRISEEALMQMRDPGKGKEFEQNRRELKRLLCKYQYYPSLFPEKFVSTWFPVPKGNKYARGWAIEYDDANAVFDLAALAANELLTRLRKCICEKWLFARFNHQRFCSAACREKEFRSSPEWKAYRRKKAREYYQLHKSGKVK